VLQWGSVLFPKSSVNPLSFRVHFERRGQDDHNRLGRCVRISLERGDHQGFGAFLRGEADPAGLGPLVGHGSEIMEQKFIDR